MEILQQRIYRLSQRLQKKYGDGHVHLTSRQSVEIPFIKLDDVEEVKEVLATGGCKPGVCGPRVRTITACQGSAVCPSGNIDSYDIEKNWMSVILQENFRISLNLV